MSGSKVISVAAGAAPATGAAVLAAIAPAVGVIMATGAVVGAAGTIAHLGVKAVQSYQDRLRREREAAERRERDIQQRIAQVRARVRSSSGPPRVSVNLPPQTNSSAIGSQSSDDTIKAARRDEQRRVGELRSRLPQVRSEYEALISQDLLDAQTVRDALQQTDVALNAGNLSQAQAHLQALDDARIQVMQQLKTDWLAQIDYLHERLQLLRDRLPASVSDRLQRAIDDAGSNWQQLTDGDLQVLHQEISEFEAQADRIWSAAENLVNSWTDVGYVARIAGIEQGDVAIEVETHEGVNTQMRVQFDGQQIDLEGPPEESNSCADRTREAMQIFQEQGYYLELRPST
ncbi:MAG: hypothetical protein AB4352_15385 [Hormoscilla sp.]